jgi:hypothetical protein
VAKTRAAARSASPSRTRNPRHRRTPLSSFRLRATPRLARSAKRGPIKAWQLPKTDDFVLTAVGGDYWRLNGPPAILDEVRATQRDASGNAPAQVIADGGEPLRCCLRDAVAGEELILFGYEPPLPVSPYREIGAIFTHAQPCTGRASSGAYPADWRVRSQVLRAYDDRGWIHAATVHDGEHPETAIAELLAVPEVVQIHSRNVAYGCYMFTVTRDTSMPSLGQ